MPTEINQNDAGREQLENDLHEGQSLFHSLFDQSPIGILIYNTKGGMIDINPVGMAILGVTGKEEIQNLNLFRDVWLSPEVAARLKTGENVQYETVFDFEQVKRRALFATRHSGSCYLNIRISPIHAGDQTTGYMLHVMDITEQRRSEQAEHEMRVWAEALRDVAATLNSTLNLDKVLDHILSRIAGILPHDAVAVMLLDEGIARIQRHSGFAERGMGSYLESWAARAADIPPLRKVMETSSWIIIDRAKGQPAMGWFPFSPEAEWINAALSVPLRSRGAITGFLTVYSAVPGFFNATHAQRLQVFADQAASAIANARLYKEVHELSRHDDLTGLYNRRALLDLGRQEIYRSRRFKRPMTMLFIDIDHFKEFNDRYSYITGDHVLRFIAEQIHSSLRDVDVLGRYGGEEFVALLTECGLPEAIEVGERLRMKIEDSRVYTESGDLGVTVSIGIAQLRQNPGMTGILTGSDQKTLDELFRRAGQALHSAKERGRNRVEVAPDIMPYSLDDQEIV